MPTTRSVRRRNQSLRDQNTALRRELHQMQHALAGRAAEQTMIKNLTRAHAQAQERIAGFQRMLAATQGVLRDVREERDDLRKKLRAALAAMEDAREMVKR